jgi:hypothetical protein
MAGEFQSIKLGVCDCFWTPNGVDTEVFLGLTKGGVELNYTPEWYEINVDQFGKTLTDAALVGETISVKIPLAETDNDKLKMFAHTGTWDETNKKLTFGRFPGMRLELVAGKLRIHPIAMGSDRSEDVTIYKAVNRAPLKLAYKIDGERIYETEFFGMIKRANGPGKFLWEIGDSSVDTVPTVPTNLETDVQAQNGDFDVSPTTISNLVSTAGANHTVQFTVQCLYNYVTYDITDQVTYSLANTSNLKNASSAAAPIATISSTGLVTAFASADVTGGTFGAENTAIADDSTITDAIRIAWAGKTHIIPVTVTYHA